MERTEIAGLELDVEIVGAGEPLLCLLPEYFRAEHAGFVAELGTRWQVHSPVHPGFDGRTPPSTFRSVGDIAYLYLDLIERLDAPVRVLAASLGGWIALEMAVRSTRSMLSLALIAPLGVKFGGREEREYTDLFALDDAEALGRLFAHSPPGLLTFGNDALTQAARDRQYLAYYGWKPYLHQPGLERWLHRIDIPVQLIWGECDGFVSTAMGERLADSLPNGRLAVIPGAAHYPQLEVPEAVLAAADL